MTEERWQQVKALFEVAVERPIEERADFLAAATGDDDALRREVESLLVSDTSDVGFFDHLPVASEPGLTDSFAAPPASIDQARSHATLTSGFRLGPFEILAPLGAGAMGDMYRACDTKLNREVALKVLPSLFALDPDRLARFKREAQVLATLSHPNIAAIYGLEELNGAPALVLELVDGTTLADRIAHGPIALGEALTIARQIAEALEAAHEKCIIHRDLKPANVKIASNGAVKVLDFGRAKVWDGAPRADRSGSPTLTATGMGEQAILGTPTYMSPEQARGRPLDRRTDLWSFGCVLYEMLPAARRSPARPSPTPSPRFLNANRTERCCRPIRLYRFAGSATVPGKGSQRTTRFGGRCAAGDRRRYRFSGRRNAGARTEAVPSCQSRGDRSGGWWHDDRRVCLVGAYAACTRNSDAPVPLRDRGAARPAIECMGPESRSRPFARRPPPRLPLRRDDESPAAI